MAKQEIVKVDVFRNFKGFIPQEKSIEFNGTKIKVKQYLGMKKKEIILKLMQDMSFLEDASGVESYSPTNKEMTFVYLILKHYTNINLSVNDDSRDTYDIAIGSGLFDKVCEAIPQEELNFMIDEIENYIDIKLQEIMNRSQIMDQLKEIINDAIEKLPKEIDINTIVSELGKLDNNKAKNVLEIMNSVAMNNKK